MNQVRASLSTAYSTIAMLWFEIPKLFFPRCCVKVHFSIKPPIGVTTIKKRFFALKYTSFSRIYLQANGSGPVFLGLWYVFSVYNIKSFFFFLSLVISAKVSCIIIFITVLFHCFCFCLWELLFYVFESSLPIFCITF